MHKYRSLILSLLLLQFTNSAWSKDLTASSVLDEISQSDASKVISKYFGKPEWNFILKKIGTADANWLKVYVELRKGSDGGSGEDLSAALWDVALPQAPFKVFEITHNSSCEFTFEADCPPDGIEGYLNRLEKSLNKASTPSQHKMKKECLAGIKKTRDAFPNPKAYCRQ